MLAPDQIDSIDDVAKKARISRSDVVRDLLDRGLRDLEREQNRNRVLRQLDEEATA